MTRKIITLALFTVLLSGCDKEDEVRCESGFAAVIDSNGEYICEPISE